ncbi:glycosyltransferase family 2 protein [Alloyangia pacifica]|uniref:Glycosyl transferase family 2 n=1 Tax=Alloyangia pacifica TaxID=311180 RepID=A0A1I6P5Y9_9RHOB|nr:glycosyltransferase family 2 protein [Alloyangia pacifica]SDG20084.1 Glycosyl transferase family 2 [Alloyangia pacifica]SFS35607.1 Glycosyl transferase family 2 [Alloyangia pacifica]
MAPYTIDRVADLVESVSRPVDPGKLTIFSTFRNEMALCPAFFEHYRSIGAEQFLIMDDRSDDGSEDWLDAQPDCCVVRTRFRFGEEIEIQLEGAEPRMQRAGTFYKIALPHLWFDGAYVTYVDADEFLFLPPGVGSLQEIAARLKAEGAEAALASVVEFFPASVEGLSGPLPQSFEGMLEAYPYFQAEQLVALAPGGMELVGESKTARLFAHYDIRPRVERRGWHRIYMPSRVRKAQSFQKAARHKTPMVLRSGTSGMVDTHNASAPPSQSVLLTLAHFVYTAEFADKIARAISWGAHANGAAKYRYYAELLEKMGGVENGFLDENSVRYEGPEQLVALGLMRW